MDLIKFKLPLTNELPEQCVSLFLASFATPKIKLRQLHALLKLYLFITAPIR